MTMVGPNVIIATRLAQDQGHGGHGWAMLNWILGAEALGWSVSILEATDLDRIDTLHPAGTNWARSALRSHGVQAPFTVLDQDGRTLWGDWDDDDLARAIRTTDVVLNISGNWRGDELGSIAHRVYVDLDPGFTQWWAAEDIDMGLDRHTTFVTVGLRLGTAGCSVPTMGKDWVTTPPPVMLDRWLPSPSVAGRPYTTIANWRSYGTVWRDGVRHGQKAHSMRALIDLPGRTGVPIEVALRIHPAEHQDLTALHRAGWRIVDPTSLTATPQAYQRYVQRSRGEFGLAKEGYVNANTGWISDRTACFLASGRPVVTQETGSIEELGGGEGLLGFSTTDEAATSLERVERDWAHHAAAARALASARFDHRRVLPRVMSAVA